MALIGIKLASNTAMYVVLCICSGRGPKEIYTEGLANKCPSRSVVSAESDMDFSQELPPFLFGDASLEHSDGTFLIEFSLMDFVGLGTSHNTTCFILVLGELLPI